MEVIYLQEDALVEQVVDRLGQKNSVSTDRWIDGEEAMRKLRIKSTTTLQALRDVAKVRFTQPSKKIILYDTISLDEYLEKNAHETFYEMEDEQKVSEQYKKALNHGYMFREQMSHVLEGMKIPENEPSDYTQGFSDGVKHYEQNMQFKLLDEMNDWITGVKEP